MRKHRPKGGNPVLIFPSRLRTSRSTLSVNYVAAFGGQSLNDRDLFVEVTKQKKAAHSGGFLKDAMH